MKARLRIRLILLQIRKVGFADPTPFKIGKVERRMHNYAARNNILLTGNDIYMSAHSISHAIRPSKAKKGIVVSDLELERFPSYRRKMELFYSLVDGAFIYLDRKRCASYIIKPHYEIKIRRKKTNEVTFITASRLKSTQNFGYKNRYEKI